MPIPRHLFLKLKRLQKVHYKCGKGQGRNKTFMWNGITCLWLTVFLLHLKKWEAKRSDQECQVLATGFYFMQGMRTVPFPQCINLYSSGQALKATAPQTWGWSSWLLSYSGPRQCRFYHDQNYNQKTKSTIASSNQNNLEATPERRKVAAKRGAIILPILQASRRSFHPSPLR